MSDPRGPLRTVTGVDRTPAGNLTRFEECDHVAHLNPSMAPARPGERVRCFWCGPAGQRRLAREAAIRRGFFTPETTGRKPTMDVTSPVDDVLFSRRVARKRPRLRMQP